MQSSLNLTPFERSKKNLVFKLGLEKLREQTSTLGDVRLLNPVFSEKVLSESVFLKPKKAQKFNRVNKQHLDKSLDQLMIYLLNRQYFLSNYVDVFKFSKTLTKRNLKRYRKALDAIKFLKTLDISDL